MFHQHRTLPFGETQHQHQPQHQSHPQPPNPTATKSSSLRIGNGNSNSLTSAPTPVAPSPSQMSTTANKQFPPLDLSRMDAMYHRAALEYDNFLQQLTFNSKEMITNLTRVAGENVQACRAIAMTIQQRIFQAAPMLKLPFLYLMDSIVKNIGNDYIPCFASNLFHTFMTAYSVVPHHIRASMHRLLNTWPPYFGLDIVSHIHRAVNDMQQQQQYPQQNQHVPNGLPSSSHPNSNKNNVPIAQSFPNPQQQQQPLMTSTGLRPSAGVNVNSTNMSYNNATSQGIGATGVAKRSSAAPTALTTGMNGSAGSVPANLKALSTTGLATNTSQQQQTPSAVTTATMASAAAVSATSAPVVLTPAPSPQFLHTQEMVKEITRKAKLGSAPSNHQLFSVNRLINTQLQSATTPLPHRDLLVSFQQQLRDAAAVPVGNRQGNNNQQFNNHNQQHIQRQPNHLHHHQQQQQHHYNQPQQQPPQGAFPIHSNVMPMGMSMSMSTSMPVSLPLNKQMIMTNNPIESGHGASFNAVGRPAVSAAMNGGVVNNNTQSSFHIHSNNNNNNNNHNNHNSNTNFPTTTGHQPIATNTNAPPPAHRPLMSGLGGSDALSGLLRSMPRGLLNPASTSTTGATPVVVPPPSVVGGRNASSAIGGLPPASANMYSNPHAHIQAHPQVQQEELKFSNIASMSHAASVRALYVDLPFLSKSDGMRFESKEQLRDHLDWVFQRNKQKRSIANKETISGGRSRNWFDSVEEYMKLDLKNMNSMNDKNKNNVSTTNENHNNKHNKHKNKNRNKKKRSHIQQHDNGDDANSDYEDDHGRQHNHKEDEEKRRQQQDKEALEKRKHCIPVKGDSDSEVCGACGESFETYWDDDRHCWMMMDAIRSEEDDEVFHTRCLESTQVSTSTGSMDDVVDENENDDESENDNDNDCNDENGNDKNLLMQKEDEKLINVKVEQIQVNDEDKNRKRTMDDIQQQQQVSQQQQDDGGAEGERNSKRMKIENNLLDDNANDIWENNKKQSNQSNNN